MQRTMIIRYALLLSLLGLMCYKSRGQVDSTFRVDAFRFNQKLGRGVNFMASKINLNHHHPLDFKLIRENHFMHVRLGSRLWQHFGSAPDYTIDANRLQAYKNAIDWALAEGLMVVVDPIHYWRNYTDADLPILMKLWEQIGTMCANYPLDKVALEIMNEPESYSIDLKAIIDSSLHIIRNISGNEKRIVIVSGQSFSTRQALIDAFKNNVVFPTQDPYLIGTFHYYDPRSFTKQGAAGNIYWADGGNSDSDWQDMASAFDEVVTANENWASRNHTMPLPIYCGEYGVDNGAPSTDRIRWHGWVRMKSEERNFSHAIWNLYNNSPSSKGLGPWTSLEINDPSKRTLDQNILNPIRNRYEMESGLYSGSVTSLSMSDCSNATVASFQGNAENSLKITSIYLAKEDRYDIYLRFQNNHNKAFTSTISSILNTNGRVYDSARLDFPPTRGNWLSGHFSLNFPAGQFNQLQIEVDGGNDMLFMDFMAITQGRFCEHVYPDSIIDLKVPSGVVQSVDPAEGKHFKVYPNPASDTILIQGEFDSWKLMDIEGTKIGSGKMAKIKVSSYQAGIYILQIDDEKFKILIR